MINFYFAFVLTTLLFSQIARSEKTCAKQFMNLYTSIGSAHLFYQSKALRSASFIKRDAVCAKKRNEALKWLNQFYNDLVQTVPKTQLGRQEVFELLARINANSVKNGRCPNDGTGLISNFFSSEKHIADYIEHENNWETKKRVENEKNKKEIAHAAAIRKAKNQDF